MQPRIFDCCPLRKFGPAPKLRKRVLYYSAIRSRSEELLEAFGRSRECSIARCDHRLIRAEELGICWLAESEESSVFEVLEKRYVNLFILDLRYQKDEEHQEVEACARRILETMDGGSDIEARYGFHRILALVSGDNPERIDQLIAKLGAMGVGSVMRERVQCQGVQEKDSFAGRVFDESLRLMRKGRTGKRAICASGGGITGLYFELGSLKCLSDCFSANALNNFDLYFGISAGAVVTSLLATGFSVDEIMASLAGVEGGRIPPMSFRLFKGAHLNVQDLNRRFWRVLGATWGGLWEVVQGRRKVGLDSVFLDYSDVVGPLFHSEGFERMLRQVLSIPGATNDFRRVRRPLFIGASDQDARKHVLFGAEGVEDVPISKAVQASLSVNPAFSAVSIRGRYFEDGAVTRTSNFSEAIERGSDLIFVLDPFVPYVSKKPGFAARRGMLYNIDQDIRTMSYTRFETARNWVLRKHPEVSSYTFLPSNRLRKLLSINPMDHRPYLEIWRGAYLSTLERIKRLVHRMRGDLLCHGVFLDTSKAEQVASQLRRATNLRFADFYPDRRVEICCPPLSLEEGEVKKRRVRSWLPMANAS